MESDQAPTPPVSPIHKKNTPWLGIAISVISFLTVVAAFVGSVVFTVTLFGVSTDQEQYANAVTWTGVFFIISTTAALIIGRAPIVVAPVMVAVLTGLFTISSFMNYLGSSGYAFYAGDGGVIATFFLAGVFACPLVVLTALASRRRSHSYLIYSTVIGLIALAFFFVAFVVPNHFRYNSLRADEARRVSQQKSEQKAEEALQNTPEAKAEKASEEATSMLSSRYLHIVRREWQASAGVLPTVAPHAEADYDILDYARVSKDKFSFCLKPKNEKYYVTIVAELSAENYMYDRVLSKTSCQYTGDVESFAGTYQSYDQVH